MKTLAEVRVKHGLTQDDVALALDISVNAYRNIEKGTSRPKEERIQKLEELFPKTNVRKLIKKGRN